MARLTLPPLASQAFVDIATGALSRIGLSFQQSVVTAIDTLQAQLPTPSSPSYANDAAAEAGGVAVGGYYRNGSVVQVRVS